MTTSRPSPRLFQLPMAFALAAACVGTLVAAQQPAPPQPDRAALSGRPRSTSGRHARQRTLCRDQKEIGSLPRHVVYRPKDLGALGTTKLGVVAWGNGGCSDDAASSRFHLLEIASHGYLVLASGRILVAPVRRRGSRVPRRRRVSSHRRARKYRT